MYLGTDMALWLYVVEILDTYCKLDLIFYSSGPQPFMVLM